MGRSVHRALGRDINNSDTTGYNLFADASLTANAESQIGSLDIPAGVQSATWGGGKLYVVLYDDSTTAAREEGTFVFKVRGPGGESKETHRIDSYQAGADGQGSTPSEWLVMPEGNDYASGGGTLDLFFISAAADILDTTDCYFYSIPYVFYT